MRTEHTGLRRLRRWCTTRWTTTARTVAHKGTDARAPCAETWADGAFDGRPGPVRAEPPAWLKDAVMDAIHDVPQLPPEHSPDR
ncbi:hypothetical protein ABT160_46805 [Streptomyces sp. NPDC001941]|uniref:hypothetical protein n=1 Tax=Streptomyces sp. NPDC001941 TaxID=3154659 RepID=UPI003324742B